MTAITYDDRYTEWRVGDFVVGRDDTDGVPMPIVTISSLGSVYFWDGTGTAIARPGDLVRVTGHIW
jgi:hypothetical protein